MDETWAAGVKEYFDNIGNANGIDFYQKQGYNTIALIPEHHPLFNVGDIPLNDRLAMHVQDPKLIGTYQQYSDVQDMIIDNYIKDALNLFGISSEDLRAIRQKH